MSEDPVRLISDPKCPSERQSLLQLGVRMEPPKDAEAEVWRSLTGALGGPGGGSAMPAGGVAAKYVSMAGVLMLAAAGGTMFWFNHHHDRAVTPAIHSAASETPAPVQAVPIVPAPTEPVIDLQVAAPEPAPHGSAPAHPPRPAHRSSQPTVVPPSPEGPAPAEATAEAEPPVNAPASPASHLREEIELVRSARQALRAGRASQALQILEDSRRRFPSAALEQERERLTIEALSASGRTAEASARAAAFLRKFPTSPHAREIHELAR